MEAPTRTSKRIPQIDALRGFALFGILMVNIFVFHAPYAHYGPFYYQFEGTQIAALEWMVNLFAGNFMFIYAFLFGYGCWMQYEKFDSTSDFRSYWNRRMIILAAFGILHVLLLSFGDILLPYALLGLTLPFLLHLKDRTLILLALLVYLIPVYEFVIRAIVEYPSIFDHTAVPLETYLQVNSEENLWEIFKLRMHDYWSFKNEKVVVYIPKEWALFIVGIIASRHKLATQLNLKKDLLLCAIALAFVVFKLFFKSAFVGLFDIENSILQRSFVGFMIQASEFAHGMLYILGFWLLWKSNLFQKAFSILQYPGRLSLTNYIMQSLICVIIFSGFGYYGGLNPIQLIVLAMVIFAAQVIFSYFWLQNHRFGPLEGIWRKLSKRSQ